MLEPRNTTEHMLEFHHKHLMPLDLAPPQLLWFMCLRGYYRQENEMSGTWTHVSPEHEGYMRTHNHLCAHVPSGTWLTNTRKKREIMFHWSTCTCTDWTWTRNMSRHILCVTAKRKERRKAEEKTRKRRHILIIRRNMNSEHELVHKETRGHASFTEHEHDHGTWASIYSSVG